MFDIRARLAESNCAVRNIYSPRVSFHVRSTARRERLGRNFELQLRRPGGAGFRVSDQTPESRRARPIYIIAVVYVLHILYTSLSPSASFVANRMPQKDMTKNDT